jgi:flagellar motor switch protein FliN
MTADNEITPEDLASEEEMRRAMETEAPEAQAAVETTGTPADFTDFQSAPEAGTPSALSMLYDLTMPVAIELGRTRMSVQEILALGRGSVIQLDRLAGEPIDVFVGDRRFAEGEVVVVGEQFGVRITRILGGTAPTGTAQA